MACNECVTALELYLEPILRPMKASDASMWVWPKGNKQ